VEEGGGVQTGACGQTVGSAAGLRQQGGGQRIGSFRGPASLDLKFAGERRIGTVPYESQHAIHGDLPLGIGLTHPHYIGATSSCEIV
jgi:hypothetical protein